MFIFHYEIQTLKRVLRPIVEENSLTSGQIWSRLERESNTSSGKGSDCYVLDCTSRGQEWSEQS